MEQERLDRIERMLARLLAEREAPAYLTSEEAARRMRTSNSTIARWRQRGTGPRFTRVAGRPIYSVEAIDEWMEENARSF